MPDVQIKRIYEAPAESAGLRVLVDRLWPRGAPRRPPHSISGSRSFAPSTELRKWFNHDPQAWGRTFACAIAANCKTCQGTASA